MERDLFVAAVAGLTGGLLISVSIFNQSHFFEFRTPAALSKMVGRLKARWIIGFAGGLLVGISLYLGLQAVRNNDFSRADAVLERVEH